MTRSVLVLVVAFAAPALVPVGDAGAQTGPDPGATAAAECAARLRAESEAGSGQDAPRLADVCAELARELESGAWGAALGNTSVEELSARPFEELVDVIAHYERPPSAAPLAVDQLAAVVESLRPFEPVAQPSLGERIRDWIRERLGFGDARGEGGLIEWLRNLSIPEEWTRTIVYVLGITIVIAALVIAVNELRLSGLFGGGQGGTRAREANVLPAWAKRVPLTYEVVKRAPAASQPVLLLTMLVERMRARFGEAVRDSFTHRELAAKAAALGLRRQSELDAVVAAAERVTFAGWRPEPMDVEPVVLKGKAVLDELDPDRRAADADPR